MSYRAFASSIHPPFWRRTRSGISGPMAVSIGGIGGEYDERIVGAAADPRTANSLIRLIELTGGTGVSLMGHNRGASVDCEVSLAEARKKLA